MPNYEYTPSPPMCWSGTSGANHIWIFAGDNSLMPDDWTCQCGLISWRDRNKIEQQQLIIQPSFSPDMGGNYV